MTRVDLLSDTVYPQEAVKQLHHLLGSNGQVPVKRTQIYGLCQIARQQPDQVLKFAEKQSRRAENLQKQSEVDFWALVAKLCSPSTSEWSVYKEGHAYLPKGIRDEDIPPKQSGITQKEREHINALKSSQNKWLAQWANEHIPVFFERFCTQCLYRKAMIETPQPTNESDAASYQEQSEPGGNEAMRRAFTEAEQQG